MMDVAIKLLLRVHFRNGSFTSSFMRGIPEQVETKFSDICMRSYVASYSKSCILIISLNSHCYAYMYVYGNIVSATWKTPEQYLSPVSGNYVPGLHINVI